MAGLVKQCVKNKEHAHLVFFYSALDVLQVRSQCLSPHLLNTCFCYIQPVCELLQLLMLQVHQNFMESGSEMQFSNVLF